MRTDQILAASSKSLQSHPVRPTTLSSHQLYFSIDFSIESFNVNVNPAEANGLSQSVAQSAHTSPTSAMHQDATQSFHSTSPTTLDTTQTSRSKSTQTMEQLCFVMLTNKTDTTDNSNLNRNSNEGAPTDSHSSGAGFLAKADGAMDHTPCDHATTGSESKRSQVKKFLGLLHDNNIGYSNLAQELLDPEILRALYTEMGISEVDRPTISVGQEDSTKQVSPPGSSMDPKIVQGEQLTAQGQTNTTLKLPSVSAEAPVANEQKASSEAANAPKPVASDAVPQVSSAPIPGIAKSTSATTSAAALTTVSEQPTTAASKRDEYIAKLKAARRGKSTESNRPDVAATKGSVQESETIVPKEADPQSNLGNGPRKTPDTASEAKKATTPPSVTKIAAAPQNKREAQTELARLRIEELNKSKAQNTKTAPLPTPTTIPGLTFGSIPQSAVSTPQLVASSSQEDLPAPQDTILATKAISPAPQDTISTTQVATSAPQDTTLTPQHAAPASQQVLKDASIGGSFASGSRKRPVALDFDHFTPQPPTKKPFGQSRNEEAHDSFIIEASDEESDDEETKGSRVRKSNTTTATSKAGTRETPRLTDFPPRPVVSRHNTGVGSPAVKPSPLGQTPLVATPGSVRTLADLSAHMAEIEDMKRKIHLAEEQQRKQKAKLSRPQTPLKSNQSSSNGLQPSSPAVPLAQTENSSSTGAPAQPLPNFTAHVPPMPNPASQTTQSAESQSQMHTRQTMSPLTQTRTTYGPTMSQYRPMTPTPPIRSNSSSPAFLSESERKRRAELETKLSTYNAAKEAKKARLEQLRKEMEEIEEQSRKEEQERADLASELEGLGVDTEGMPKEEMWAKKNEIIQQQELQALAGNGKEMPLVLYANTADI